jgi:uncharacterized protein (DUF433 family)
MHQFFIEMEYKQYIEVNPLIMMGKPVIKGTRITVEQIIEELSGNNSVRDILVSHPHLSREQVNAALSFAAEIVRGDEIYPIAQ